MDSVSFVTSMKLGNLLPDADLPEESKKSLVSGVSLDSRTITPGDVFIALKGYVTDGEQYIESAIKKGAAVVVIDADSQYELPNAAVPIIKVSGLKENISHIASLFYNHPSYQMGVIGVTGTNGKTTCALMLSQLLHKLGKASASVGTLGYGKVDEPFVETGLTTPDAVTCQKILHELFHRETERVVMEVSSHAIAQGRVEAIRFDGAIFTNLSRDHLDYHRDLEEYKNTKAQLFRVPSLKFAVVNIDDPVGEEFARIAEENGTTCVTFAVKNKHADVHVKQVDYCVRGMTVNILTPWGSGLVRTQLVGGFNLYNLLAVIAAACASGESLQAACSVFSELKAVPGRMERVCFDEEAAGEKLAVFVDYAHTPDALEKVILSLRPHVNKKLWVVFGCGGNRDSGKREIMGSVCDQHADQIVVTSDNPRFENPEEIIEEILNGISQEHRNDQNKVIARVDRKEAIQYAIENASSGDCVLIAGKGHEQYQLIKDQRLPFSDMDVAKTILINKKVAAGAAL